MLKGCTLCPASYRLHWLAMHDIWWLTGELVVLQSLLQLLLLLNMEGSWIFKVLLQRFCKILVVATPMYNLLYNLLYKFIPLYFFFLGKTLIPCIVYVSDVG